jgi:glutaredoxin 3
MAPIRDKDGKEESPTKIIETMISENSVAIFSKSYCPYCTKVKDFFKSHGISFKAIELDTMDTQGAEIQSALLEKTGQSTVPSVWVNGKFIGEYLQVHLYFDVSL